MYGIGLVEILVKHRMYVEKELVRILAKMKLKEDALDVVLSEEEASLAAKDIVEGLLASEDVGVTDKLGLRFIFFPKGPNQNPKHSILVHNWVVDRWLEVDKIVLPE